MAADARIEPVGDVERAVGADRDVGRTEQRLDLAGGCPRPPEKSVPAYRSSAIGRHEDRAVSSLKPAPSGSGWYAKIALRPGSAASSMPRHLSPSAPFS